MLKSWCHVFRGSHLIGGSSTDYIYFASISGRLKTLVPVGQNRGQRVATFTSIQDATKIIIVNTVATFRGRIFGGSLTHTHTTHTLPSLHTQSRSHGTTYYSLTIRSVFYLIALHFAFTRMQQPNLAVLTLIGLTKSNTLCSCDDLLGVPNNTLVFQNGGAIV